MELTQREYELKCKVKVIDQNWRHYTGKNIEDKAVVLIPKDSSQKDLFMAAWLPEDSTEHFEVVATIGHPVHSPMRCSVHRRNQLWSNDHHLYVMSKAVVDELIHMHNKEVNIIVLPESADNADTSVADSTKF